MAALFAVLAFTCATASSAAAATVTDRPLLFSFDGSDATAGEFEEVRSLAIDQASGFIYVMDEAKNVIGKFDLDGNAQSFAATGESSLSPGFASENSLGDISVDNSSVNSGRLYVVRNSGPVRAFTPQGQVQFEFYERKASTRWAHGGAVDTEGHLWIGNNVGQLSAREFASSGSPPSEIASVSLPLQVQTLDVDANGSLYVNYAQGGQQVDKYVGGAKVATIDPSSVRSVAVDQSGPGGHVFTLHLENFNEYDSSGALHIASMLGAFSNGEALAYSETLDRLYVGDRFSDTVKVFGPAVTGTVPDPEVEGPSGVSFFGATFNGTVNPRSVPNSYFFEWARANTSDWTTSPPQSLPQDSEDHAVSFETGSLKSNTTYQLRLVTVNTETKLRNVSAPITFTTDKPPPPTASIESPTAVTASSAHIAGLIDPQKDETEWQVETSTDASCAAGFSSESSQTIPGGEAGSVTVSWDLEDLLPDQHYCVRIRATNGGGSSLSGVEEFETDAIPPSEALTAFVAPRLATSARLNGYVNPEGSELDYFFEVSSDGGESWTATPEVENSDEAREQIVVGQEIGGLDPNTTYWYRFIAGNDAGEAAPQGDTRTFTTRRTAEVGLPPNAFGEADRRGVELVNNSDKGNQNARPAGLPASSHAPPLISPDGERALWAVTGGAPGGNTASGDTFLAQRTPGGWRSRTLIPPASGQFGGGRFAYIPYSVTPDLSHFLFATAKSEINLSGAGALVRIGLDQKEEVLNSALPGEAGVEVSDDGAHAVVFDRVGEQIEEVGGGKSSLLSLMPGGTPAGCGAKPFPWKGTHGRAGNNRIAVTDASRVYFQAAPNGACGAPAGLYLRNREAAKGKGETTLIDPGEFGQSPEIIRASADGRSVFFTTFSRLDAGDENTGRDVYRWDEGSGQATCLTCVVPEAAVRKSALVSDDASHVYFESPRQLVAGRGKAGAGNVYVLSGGQLRFVATPDSSTDEGALGLRLARASADGSVLALSTEFASNPSLTGDRLAAQCPTLTKQEQEGTPLSTCVELYLYDDRGESLECVSCKRDGVTTHRFGTPNTGSQVGLPGDFAISADGSTVAFPTAEALVPEDVNGDTDIYEWRNGVRRLLSDGISETAEQFAAPAVQGIDADGSDVLFSIAQPGLTGFEQDGLANFYDARIGGGFEAPSPPARCSGDSCQGSLGASPAAVRPDSERFRGTGDLLTAPSCRSDARRARRLARRAKQLRARAGSARRRAARAHLPQRSRAMRREARRLAKAAQRTTRTARRRAVRAKRCRRANAARRTDR